MDASGPIRPPDGAVEGRGEVAAARDDAAAVRDRQAENRDEVAATRDAAADDRDRAGAGGDATTLDPAPGESGTGAEPGAPPRDRMAGGAPFATAADRTAAYWDRRQAMSDRGEAADDRSAAAADRGASALDRAAALVDDLTGAYRRAPGFMELEREIARARRTDQRLVLVFVDVDGLKTLNDSRGHVVGDRVLRDVVAALRATLRSYDLIVRVGGDEFLCAIPGVSMEEAAQRLAVVNTTLAASPEHPSVTSGLADLQANDSLQDMIVRADEALYEQRRQQRVVNLTAEDHAHTHLR